MSKKQKFSFMTLQLPYNDTIKMNAAKFLESIKVPFPYISVHIRTEKLAQMNTQINGYTDCCLNMLDNLITLLKNKYPNVNSTIAITDVGKYGSMSCYGNKVCLKHAKYIQSRLTSMGLALVSFDPKVTGGSENSAYVSLVEMNMLAMGDLLIVMGKGSFKGRIISEFLQSNPISKVYHICTEHGNNLHNINPALDKKCS